MTDFQVGQYARVKRTLEVVSIVAVERQGRSARYVVSPETRALDGAPPLELRRYFDYELEPVDEPAGC